MQTLNNIKSISFDEKVKNDIENKVFFTKNKDILTEGLNRLIAMIKNKFVRIIIKGIVDIIKGLISEYSK